MLEIIKTLTPNVVKLYPDMIKALYETIYMVSVSGVISAAIGIPLRVTLVVTRPGRFNALFKEVMEGLGENVDDNTDGGLGSTDAGNVSHIVTTIQPSIKIGPCDLVPHTPEFCEAARSKQGDDGLILGAKALALTGLVLLTDDEELKRIKDEFKQDTMGEKTLSSEGFFSVPGMGGSLSSESLLWGWQRRPLAKQQGCLS